MEREGEVLPPALDVGEDLFMEREAVGVPGRNPAVEMHHYPVRQRLHEEGGRVQKSIGMGGEEAVGGAGGLAQGQTR